MSKQAVIFVNIWPEPSSSAAGVRSCEVAHFLQKMGYSVIAFSPSPFSIHSQKWSHAGVRVHVCDPNSSQEAEALKSFAPQIVVYDRFYVEEQFGWRARQLWPQALHVIDTSDIHCLRNARERVLKKQGTWEEIQHPPTPFFAEDRLRELSALHRADLSFVVSGVEAQWLVTQGIEPEKIVHLPFSSRIAAKVLSFEERKDFCFIGNYLHAPNLDAAKWLIAELWPQVQKKMPHAHLNLYGAYPTPWLLQQKKNKGIHVHGPVEDHKQMLSRHIASLAPLRFGAGIKGKILDSWSVGTPVVGTPIAFEGMDENHSCFTEVDEFLREIELVCDPEVWRQRSSHGVELLMSRFHEDVLFEMFQIAIDRGLQTKDLLRKSLVGEILRHNQNQWTKYFSLWIEEKNKNKKLDP